MEEHSPKRKKENEMKRKIDEQKNERVPVWPVFVSIISHFLSTQFQMNA